MDAARAWLILTIGVIVYVVAFDSYARATHKTSMSTQFHMWLVNPRIGPIIFGLWVGIFVALTFHWFQYKGK